jgi:hypothetical protein
MALWGWNNCSYIILFSINRVVLDGILYIHMQFFVLVSKSLLIKAYVVYLELTLNMFVSNYVW